MIQNLYAQGNCVGAFLGTGTGACELGKMGDLVGNFLLEKGFNFKEMITKTAYTKAIKDGMIYPIIGTYGFTQDTPDSETATSDTGIIQEIREGKPQFTFTVTKGYCAHKKLYDKKNGLWDLGFIFEKGILVATDIEKSVIKGFDMSYYNVATYKFQQGTDVENSLVSVQLRSANEFNTRMVFLTWEQLGFDASIVDGAIETTLQGEPKAGTEITVKALGFCNTSVSIDDLDDPTNWKVNGVVPTAVSLDVATGAYKLEFTNALVAGTQVTITLDAEDVRGKIYKGRLVAEVKA